MRLLNELCLLFPVRLRRWRCSRSDLKTHLGKEIFLAGGRAGAEQSCRFIRNSSESFVPRIYRILKLESAMAVIILAVVLTIITGAHYFGRNLARPVWLVLFILSVVALLWLLVAYRSLI